MKEYVIHLKRGYQWAIGFLVLSLLSFSGLAVRIWQDRNNDFSMRINGASDADVVVQAEVCNVYEAEELPGKNCVQYTGWIENKLDMALTDLRLQAVIPSEEVSAVTWSSEYPGEADLMTLTEEEPATASITPGAKEKFSFVLYSESVPEISEFILTGHRYAHITDYSIFYLAAVLLLASMVVFAWQIAFDVRTKQLKLERVRDEKIISEIMWTLANLIDAKDEYTKGHSARVAEYSRKLAKKMRLTEEQIKDIGYVALMHDCGKMGIPDEILNKSGVLTSGERRIVEQHVLMGGEILGNITSIDGIREGALYHHERYDGKGYPEGLVGDQIPLYARIICVADSFDAMNSDRGYREKLSKERIYEELAGNAGRQFDPDIVMHMLKMIEDEEV